MKCFIFLFVLQQIILSHASTSYNCYSCAIKSDGNIGAYQMCVTPKIYENPYEVSCCDTTNTLVVNCKTDPNTNTVCTGGTEAKVHYDFYTLCPGVNGTSCGLDTINSTITTN